MPDDSSTATATGRRRRQSAPRPTPKPLAALRHELVEAYGIAGLALQQFRPLTALVVVKQAEACADAWIAAAEAFPYVRRVLEIVGQGAIPFAIISAHMPVWVALAVESRRMPLEHPWVEQIRPEVEHVMAEMERRARAEAEAASVSVDGGTVPQ